MNAKARKAAPSITLSTPLLGLIVVALLLIGFLLIWQVRPFVLWAYNLQRAEAERAVALTYPDPRLSDSLPVETDAAANQAALAHLAAAIARRPADPYAYRLAGESYLAAGDLLNAVAIMERGMEASGGDLLLGWQLALAYEQLYERTATQSGQNLVPLLVEAVPDAPALPVGTAFCEPDDPGSCYRGATLYTQPYAAYPEAGQVRAETLFLHPPARVTIPVEVPQNDPALTFLMGLDPQARQWGSDGATFQIWVVEPGGGILPVFERTVIGAELAQGWVPDSVDLKPWAGQSIQLAFGTTAGPLEDNRGDWVGFGNIYLTDNTNARYRALMPEGRFRDAVMEAPIADTQLVERGDEALYRQQFDEAARWYRRAEWAGAHIESTIAYVNFVEIQAREGWDAAFPYLESAIENDSGWGSSINRFHAFFNYGRWLTEEQVFWRSEGYLLVALAIFPDPPPTLYRTVGEVHRMLAIGYNGQGRFAEALTHARQALTYNPNDALTQFQYGVALYRDDPTRLPEAERAFSSALALDSSPKVWESVVLVWLNAGDDERARRYCESALALYSPEQLNSTCWSGEGAASASLYKEYQTLLEAGDEEGAYAQLQDAVESNGGWSDTAQRFTAWLDWTSYLYENDRYEEAAAAGQTTLTIVPEYVPAPTRARLNLMVAQSFARTEQFGAALPYFEAALTFDESHFLYFEYGKALFRADPEPSRARAAFARAVEVAPESAVMRARLIDFWYQEAQDAEAALLCAYTPMTALEETLCVSENSATASGAAFQAYLDIVESGDGSQSESDIETGEGETAVTNEEALRYLSDAITTDAGWQRFGYRHRAWLAWGIQQRADTNLAGAIEAFQRALDSEGPSVAEESLSSAAYLLGLSLYESEQFDAAAAAYERAIALSPENVYAYINYGRTLYEQDPGNVEEVRLLMERAINLAPDSVEVWRSVVGFWAFVELPAEAEFFCGEATQEIRVALGDLCLGDEVVPSRVHYFEFSAQFASNPEAAYEALEAAITTDLGWTDAEQRFTAWYFWGGRLLNTRQQEAAADAFEFAASIAPDSISPRRLSDTYQQWGFALSLIERSEEGLEKAQQAIEIDPTNALAHLLTGQLLYRTDESRLVESEAAFAEAVRLAPDNAQVWRTITSFWLAQSQPDLVLAYCVAAPASLTESLDLYCWNGETLPSTTYFSDYIFERDAGNTEAAIEALTQAIEINDGWVNDTSRYLAWRAWGIHLRTLPDHSAAVAAFENAIVYAPATTANTLLADDYFVMGLSLSALGRSTEAMDAYAEAVTLNPENPWARLNYGFALYAANSSDTARVSEQFNAALEAAPQEMRVWQEVLGFWQRNGERDALAVTCEEAQTTPFAAELAPLCTVP